MSDREVEIRELASQVSDLLQQDQAMGVRNVAHLYTAERHALAEEAEVIRAKLMRAQRDLNLAKSKFAERR